MKVLQTFALPLGYRALEKFIPKKQKTHDSEIVGIRDFELLLNRYRLEPLCPQTQQPAQQVVRCANANL